MFKASLVFGLIVGGAMASEMVSSRIVVPIPKLMKYSEAADACEAEGMQLARFSAGEVIDYATATMVEKNLDRVWIGAMGEDERKQLALQVFEGQPIVFKVEQVLDEEKMLAVLCEPNFSTVKSSLEQSVENLVLNEELIVEDNATEQDQKEEVVICTFEVDQEDKSVQVIEEDDGIDLIKCKGRRRSQCGRSARSGCSRSRRSSRCSRSSSSSSSSECGRSRRRSGSYRRGHGRRGYHRRNRRSRSKCSRSSSSSSRCSSSSSSSTCSSYSSSSCPNSFEYCSDSFSCDPFKRSGSSSSSSESKCKNKKRSHRKSKSKHCPRRKKCSKSSSSKSSKSSSSSSSSSSSKECGTSLCRRNSKRFFREISLTQRIH